jgi:hypothetical protein
MVSDSLVQSGRVTLNIPASTQPGMVEVLLDLKGRLQFLHAVSPRIRDAEESNAPPVDWTALLADAGFDPSKLVAADPSWIPPVYTDSRTAWDGVYPDRSDVKVHIEAGGAYGRPVYFQIFEPWSPQTLAPPKPPSLSFLAVSGIVVVTLIILGAVFLARRNLRLDRGDRAGAARVAVALSGLEVIAGLLIAHKSWELIPTLLVLLTLFAKSVLVGVAAYMVYMALEPDVRRRSPETLIAWSRAIAGRLSDPLVGRDLLIGTALGVLLQLINQFAHLSPLWLGQPPTLSTPAPGFDGTVPFDIATLLLQIVRSVMVASVLVLVYLLLFVVFRRRAVTTAVYVLMLALFTASVSGGGISLVFGALGIGVVVFTLARFGMLALIVAFATHGMLDQIPLTFTPGSIFAPSSYVLLLGIAALAAYGFRVSLAGQPLFGARFLD